MITIQDYNKIHVCFVISYRNDSHNQKDEKVIVNGLAYPVRVIADCKVKIPNNKFAAHAVEVIVNDDKMRDTFRYFLLIGKNPLYGMDVRHAKQIERCTDGTKMTFFNNATLHVSFCLFSSKVV